VLARIQDVLESRAKYDFINLSSIKSSRRSFIRDVVAAFSNRIELVE